MTSDEIEEFLTLYDFTKIGWKWDVPASAGTFFGRLIKMELQRSMSDWPGPDLNDKDFKLIRAILLNLPSVLNTARKELLRLDPNIADFARNPHIWIQREPINADPSQDPWTFVVERTDNEDFGHHIEFLGLDFKEIWGGD